MRYYRSGTWAAKRLNVSKASVSLWLRGKRSNPLLDAEMPKLAALLTETDGACLGVNGPSVRQTIGRLRRKSEGK